MNQFTKLFSSRVFLFAVAVLAPAKTANAHPGHHLLEQGPAHVITSPYHLLMLATMGVAVLAAAQMVRSRWTQQFLRIAGLVAVIAAGVLCALGH